MSLSWGQDRLRYAHICVLWTPCQGLNLALRQASGIAGRRGHVFARAYAQTHFCANPNSFDFLQHAIAVSLLHSLLHVAFSTRNDISHQTSTLPQLTHSNSSLKLHSHITCLAIPCLFPLEIFLLWPEYMSTVMCVPQKQNCFFRYWLSLIYHEDRGNAFHPNTPTEHNSPGPNGLTQSLSIGVH